MLLTQCKQTQSELSRCLIELTRVKLTHFTEEELKAQDEAYLQSLPKPKPKPEPAALPSKDVEKVVPTLSEEEKAMRDKWSRLIEQIRSEQVAFDRNKLRYKRYGYKLKKYCDHLRDVHGHICSPTNCGYLIGLSKSDTLEESKKMAAKKMPTNASNRSLNEHRTLHRPDSDGCYSGAESASLVDYSDLGELCDQLANEVKQAASANLVDGDKSETKNRERFRIKRTGGTIGSAISAPSLRAQPNEKRPPQRGRVSSSNNLARSTPLRPVDGNVIKSSSSSTTSITSRRPATTVGPKTDDKQHLYCYINESSLDRKARI